MNYFRASIFLTALVIMLTAPRDSDARRPPKVMWSPGSLQIECMQGSSKLVTTSFTTTGPISEASFFITRSLHPYVTVSPEAGFLIPANQSFDLPLQISVPLDAKPGTFGGTLHVRSGRSTRPEVLNISLTILAISDSGIPEQISEPSADRVATDSFGQEYIKDELILIVKDDVPNPSHFVNSLASSYGGRIIGSIPELFLYQVIFNTETMQALKDLRDLIAIEPGIESVSRSFLAQPLVIPNDTQYMDDWSTESLLGDNWNWLMVNAPSAWDVITDASNINVAIIDNSFDFKHQDLDDNIVEGPLVTQTVSHEDSMDVGIGHGTFVAGIIGGEGNNGMGITGAAWRASLIEYDRFALAFTPAAKIAERMKQAVDAKAKVVNISLGLVYTNNCAAPENDETLQMVKENNDVIAASILYGMKQEEEVLWVFAAGNECHDVRYSSPASIIARFPLNVMSIASVNRFGNLAFDSNYGELISVAAPGVGILSTLPRACDVPLIGLGCTESYGTGSGTSFAAPHVAGLAALIFAAQNEPQASEVKECIIAGAVPSGYPIEELGINVIDMSAALTCGSLPLPSEVDVIFSLDLSGSMGGELERIKSEIEMVVSGLREEVSPSSDFRFGVVSYEDYPGFFDSTLCDSLYSAFYGDAESKPGGDSPFRINQPLTAESGRVISSIESLSIGFGGDGPESYARVFWELGQSDTQNALGFRPGSLKLVVNFGDNVPHDQNLNKGIAEPALFTPDTGIDPGRNNQIDCGGDDIDFQDDALVALESSGIVLLNIDSSGDPVLGPYWSAWTSVTGGASLQINSDGSIPGDDNLLDLIISLLKLSDG